MEKGRIITLCGSTKFKEIFETVARELTLNGNIVLSPCIYSKYDNIELSAGDIKNLSDIHRDRIDISDTIYVINENGYIGEDTWEEMQYAANNGKEVVLLRNTFYINKIDNAK